MADFLIPPTNPIVLIPARLAATRLPNKPLLKIAGVPMIEIIARIPATRIAA